MLMKFSLFVLLVILVVCQTAPLYDRYDDEDDNDNKYESLTGEQLAGLDEYLSRRLSEESASKNLSRNTRRPSENSMSKRDALWTTTEVLDCVRRLKMYKNNSKLDLVTEMLNCYRRLKRNG